MPDEEDQTLIKDFDSTNESLDKEQLKVATSDATSLQSTGQQTHINERTTISCSSNAYALPKRDSDQLNTLRQTMDTIEYAIQKYTAGNCDKDDADHGEIECIDMHNFN